jgi:predicted ATPase/DNA-binding winged helix-turn-helix (wHTH) protein
VITSPLRGRRNLAIPDQQAAVHGLTLQAGAEAEYVSGPFRILPGRQELLRDGVSVTLGSRAFDVLRVLVERPGELVTKQELFDAAWPHAVVEENNLTVAVSALRRALGCGEPTRYIATVSGRGYRFVAPVERRATGASSANRSAEAAPAELPTNLPAPLESLLGRDDAIAAIAQLLAQSRLVTVTGPGGVGKTRLAVAVGRTALQAYKDGVWFVDLTALFQPELVAEAIAGALGVAIQDGNAAAGTVATYLRRRRALLVVDNCEHLIDHVSRVIATILKTCPDVAILATSREAIKLAGEQTYLVPPLATPDRVEDLTAEAALGYSAIRLFADRARRASDRFVLTDATAPIVARICRRLDGIALAIELAAPRLRTIGLSELLARLDDRFHLLAGGNRAALPRHQELRALIDWSYNLLSEPEQTLMRRLSVFAGSWTLDAAVAISADSAIEEWQVFDLLTSLVDKSLVVAEPWGQSTRYRYLESTRQYAAKELRDAGNDDPARLLAAYLVALFRTAEDNFELMPTDRWLALYGPELDNLRAALTWSFGPGGNVALGLALAAYARTLWQELSLHAERRRWLDTALENLAPATPPEIAARIHIGRAQRTTFGLRSATEDANRAEILARAAGDRRLIAQALASKANRLLRPGGSPEAEALLDEALELIRRDGNTNLCAGLMSAKAVAAILAGDSVAATDWCQQGVAIARAIGSRRALLVLLSNLCEFRFAEGDAEAAIAAAREAIDAARRADFKSNECNTRINIGAYLLVLGRTDEAAGQLRVGVTMAQSLAEDFIGGNALQHLALVIARRGNLADAARLLGHVEHSQAAEANTREATERATYEPLCAILETGLPPASLKALRLEGAALSRDDAVDLALKRIGTEQREERA